MKKVIGWILLIILLATIAGISYIKFIFNNEEDIIETPANTAASQVITTALNKIVENFNTDTKIKEYEENDIKIKATYNENSNTIFITYENESIITYEFTYDNLNLIAKISNNNENIEKFKKVEELLIYAIQKRLNNENDITEDVKSYLNGTKELEMIKEEKEEESIIYTISINKKIGDTIVEETTTDTQTENEETVTENTETNNENQ